METGSFGIECIYSNDPKRLSLLQLYKKSTLGLLKHSPDVTHRSPSFYISVHILVLLKTKSAMHQSYCCTGLKCEDHITAGIFTWGYAYLWGNFKGHRTTHMQK